MKPIFILSLPRSGSTLLQRILAAHPDIETANEPHILLPFLYSLKEKGVFSEYYHEQTAWGIQDFCLELPNGIDDYLDEIRNLTLKLYERASKKRVKYFLDKTPNYFLIAEDIINLFPEGKYILLWRNPLAIISSLMTTWHGGRWNLYHHDIHLFWGPEYLVQAYRKFPEKFLCVNYERFLTAPETELGHVLDFLELDFNTDLLSLFPDIELKGRMGDMPGIHKYKSLSKQPVKKWHNFLANPLRKWWCKRYLLWLGKDRLSVMGFELDELISEINKLPLSLRFLISDFWWMPYGFIYRLIEGRIIKTKIKTLLDRQRVYIHR